MISTAEKAKSYLEGRPFSVCYVEVDEKYSFMNEDPLFEEEYPDTVLSKEDTLIYKGKNYVVVNRVYNYDLNKFILVVQDIEVFQKNLYKK